MADLLHLLGRHPDGQAIDREGLSPIDIVSTAGEDRNVTLVDGIVGSSCGFADVDFVATPFGHG